MIQFLNWITTKYQKLHFFQPSGTK